MVTATGTITTTLVITFTDPAAAAAQNLFLSAEVDGRPDGLNKGITSFLLGDSPAFLVFKSAGLTTTMEATSGSIGGAGGGIQVKQVENITFIKTNTANLSKPAMGNSVTWIHVGGDSGALTVNGALVTTPNPILAVYQATYYASADGYRLSGVGAVAGVVEVSSVIFIEGKNA